MSAWYPTEGADYDALTIRDKIREHMILANRAELRAGPMWTNKGTARALQSAEMTQRWHDTRKIAQYHHAEVETLRKRIIAREATGNADPDLLRDAILSPEEAHAPVDEAAPRTDEPQPDAHGEVAPGSPLTPQMLRLLGRPVPGVDIPLDDDVPPADMDGAW